MTSEKHIKFAVLAVDIAVFSVIDKQLCVLTAPVNPLAYKDKRGLPGGLIHPEETAEIAVARILAEKTGITELFSEQLYTFSQIDRDPRGRVVSVAYLAMLPGESAKKLQLPTGVVFTPIKSAKALAYDHDTILKNALERLQGKLEYTTIARFLLPNDFTLSELQGIYEIVLGKKLDKRNFRKKLMGEGIVKKTGKKASLKAGRPAELFRFQGKGVRMIGILPMSA